jgi:hypothetical protein
VQVQRRAALAVSQCAHVNCTLLFNTTALTLRGAIDANGTLARTPDGTEVGVSVCMMVGVCSVHRSREPVLEPTLGPCHTWSHINAAPLNA